MSDSNELIRKAANAVGWWTEHGFPDGTRLYHGKADDELRVQYWRPEKRRADLHALVGLLEDKVREKYNGLCSVGVFADCCQFESMRTIDPITTSGEDWLFAKLEALVTAYEQ